jgi:hypothetical protein
MSKNQNIVHNYYKKAFEGNKIIVMVNPKTFEGQELTVLADGNISHRIIQFDAEIENDLSVDGFIPASPLEFHLYLSGLA